MAEFCLECWNELNGTNDPEWKYIIDKEELDLCEGCGEYKHTIVTTRLAYYCQRLRYITFPFKVIFYILYVAYRILLIPYTVYRMQRLKKKE